MARMVRRLKCRPKSILFWSILLTIIYYCKSLFYPWKINVMDWNFTDHNKCPACYGESFCPEIYREQVKLTNWTRFTITRLFNTKNYYHALYEDTQIILKKLGSEYELKNLDKKICLQANGKSINPCTPEHYIVDLLKKYSLLSRNEDPRINHEFVLQISGHSDSLQCIRSSRVMDLLVQRTKYHKSVTNLENTLTMLMFNPEPVIFMTFTEEEGWPFPNYLGSCGRLAAFENAGTMLTYYYTHSWPIRVQLARQLIRMAKKFTDNDLNVSLYLTDWSPDNFVVDKNGRLTLIDGEDIILVDQLYLEEKKSPGWDIKHTSGGGEGCENHFCYSTEDLCTHKLSDLNYYGVCKGILSLKPYTKLFENGLLHSIPEDVLRKHPLLPRLLEECANPSHSGGRFEAAEQLLDILSVM